MGRRTNIPYGSETYITKVEGSGVISEYEAWLYKRAATCIWNHRQLLNTKAYLRHFVDKTKPFTITCFKYDPEKLKYESVKSCIYPGIEPAKVNRK